MGNDKPQHIAECFGYESHINPGHTEDKQVEYLKDLHIEVGSAEEGRRGEAEKGGGGDQLAGERIGVPSLSDGDGSSQEDLPVY